jgi:hypothetical protein
VGNPTPATAPTMLSAFKAGAFAGRAEANPSLPASACAYSSRQPYGA